MASTTESRHQQPRYNNNQANGGGGQGQSYVLYPDAPQVPQPTPRKKPQQQDHHQQQQQQRSHGDLTPQSSYSSTSSSHQNRSPAPSRGNSGSNGINIAGASPSIKQSQLSYLNSPAVFSTSPSAVAPPSPISPSSPSPIEIMTGHLGRTHLDEPVQDRLQFESYDQKQYQQPRKNSGNSSTQQQLQQQRHQQLAQENESYGSSNGLKQSGSNGSARSMGSQGRDPSGALRQSPSSGSAYSVGSSPSQRQQQRAMNGELKQSGSSASAHSVGSSRSHNLNPSHSTGSATSNSSSSHMRQQQQSSSSNRGGAPTSTPSPLAHDFDQDDEKERGDNEDHQKQAFQYQQKLQQKPPSTHGGEDDSDDSDSGSMLSYRRSISRLSMSYKRTQGGVPNISLFAPQQRAAMLQGSHSSELSSSQKMIQDQREERLRQQKQQQQHNLGGGSNSSMASIDQYPRQDEGRPSMSRNHSGGGNQQQQYQGGSPQIPDRSTSTEHMNGANGRSRQQQQQQQSYPGNVRGGHPSSPNIPERQLSNQQPSHQQQQYSQQPRSNHDQGHNQSSQRSRPNQLNLNDQDSMGQRSRSPMPSGARTPGLPSQGSTLSNNGGGGGGGVYRQNGPPGSNGGGFSNSSTSLPLSSSRGPNNNGPNINQHPAHHLASGGYVRPEEAVGPSNPMPEKAEDFVRQGIEFHEIGDIAKATHFFRTAAEMGDPVGMLMYGLSVRHGWGCSSNRQLAFQYLQKSAEHAVGDLKSRDSFASTAAKGELVLAIYELGICFRHGWGADKNKKTAAYYFEIAANLVSYSPYCFYLRMLIFMLFCWR